MGPKCCHGLPWWLSSEESACQCRRCGFDPWVGKIPWRRKWQSTPVCLPGLDHGQRSLAIVHKVTKSQTRLKELSVHAGNKEYDHFRNVRCHEKLTGS